MTGRKKLMTQDGAYIEKINGSRTPLWKDRKPTLTSLDMELTERCNNNCIHCYINRPVDDPMAREKELSGKKIKEILTEAASLGCLIVRFTGGEPLLREDFEDIYLFARKLGLKVRILTNATLITPGLAMLLSRVPPLVEMEITVYGMKRQSCEAVTRTPGSFDSARRGIDLLIKANVPFIVRSVVLPPNKMEMDEFENWAATIPWMKYPPSYALSFDLRAQRDSEEKNNAIKQVRPPPEELTAILNRKDGQHTKNAGEFCAIFLSGPSNRLFLCKPGCRTGSVDAQGRFQVCMLLRHPETVYDLTKQDASLKHALRSFFPRVREMTPSNPAFLSRCARCFLRILCDQCPAKSWMEHGVLDAPVEYLCKMTHFQARALGLLNKRETGWQVKNWRDRLKELKDAR